MIFTFMRTRCELKLNHRKFNFTNHAETKWLSHDKTLTALSSNFKWPFYVFLVVLIVKEAAKTIKQV